MRTNEDNNIWQDRRHTLIRVYIIRKDIVLWRINILWWWCITRHNTLCWPCCHRGIFFAFFRHFLHSLLSLFISFLICFMMFPLCSMSIPLCFFVLLMANSYLSFILSFQLDFTLVFFVSSHLFKSHAQGQDESLVCWKIPGGILICNWSIIKL